MHASMNFANVSYVILYGISVHRYSIDVYAYIRRMAQGLFILCIIIASDKTMGMINL